MARRRIATDYELYLLRREGFSYKDIAQYYGLSVSSVRGRVSRYLKKAGARPAAPSRTTRAIGDANKDAIRDEIRAANDYGYNRIKPSWVDDHVLKAPKSKKAFHVRGSQPTLEDIMKKVIGSGIEHGQYIWYDMEMDVWFYGVDDDDIT